MAVPGPLIPEPDSTGKTSCHERLTRPYVYEMAPTLLRHHEIADCKDGEKASAKSAERRTSIWQRQHTGNSQLGPKDSERYVE